MSRRAATANSPDTTTSRRTRSTAAASKQPGTTTLTLPQSPAHTAHDTLKSSDSSGTPPETSNQLSPDEFRKIFNRLYQKFYNANKISTEEENLISSQEVDLDEFDRLTEHKQYARYISLLDGRIIFHEVLNAPHGEIIDCFVFSIHSQIDRNMFIGAVDNGKIPRNPFFCVAYV